MLVMAFFEFPIFRLAGEERFHTVHFELHLDLSFQALLHLLDGYIQILL